MVPISDTRSKNVYTNNETYYHHCDAGPAWLTFAKCQLGCKRPNELVIRSLKEAERNFIKSDDIFGRREVWYLRTLVYNRTENEDGKVNTTKRDGSATHVLKLGREIEKRGRAG